MILLHTKHNFFLAFSYTPSMSGNKYRKVNSVDLFISSSSSFKMKPMQITSTSESAEHHTQPKQFGEGDCRIYQDESSDDDNPTVSRRIYPKLPAEMCSTIFSFLGARELVVCSFVSRMWNCCSKDEGLWKVLFENNPDVLVYMKVTSCSWFISGTWMLNCIGVCCFTYYLTSSSN